MYIKMMAGVCGKTSNLYNYNCLQPILFYLYYVYYFLDTNYIYIFSIKRVPKDGLKHRG